MPRNNSISLYQNRRKAKLFKKKCKILKRWGSAPDSRNSPPIADFWQRACDELFIRRMIDSENQCKRSVRGPRGFWLCAVQFSYQQIFATGQLVER